VTATGTRAAEEQPATRSRWRAMAISIVAAVATIVALLGAAVALFFNPIWVAFEQERTQVDLWTGWAWDRVHAVTSSVVGEVFLGPGTFSQRLEDGSSVFTPSEASHMADVRGVVLGFALVVAVAIVGLVATRLADRRGVAFWRGVTAGASVLSVGIVATGIWLGFFFDTAFEIFHRLFFAAGSYTFDPLVDRLVQLFPERFWMETSIALALVGLAASIVLALVARGRMRAAAARHEATGAG
jgi:integral membrane protein (TIGR01906 family)